jgi:hypothetical protein
MQKNLARRFRLFSLIFLASVVLLAEAGQAQIRGAIRRRGAAGTVNFPYQVSDGKGETWIVYQPSTIQMQANFPIYQQAAAITVSGNQPNMQTAPRIDDKTGELIMDNLQVGGFVLTRRILFNTDDGYMRVIDLVKNSTGGDQQLNLQLVSYVFNPQSSQMIPDPKKGSQNIAWCAATGAGSNKAALDVYAGPGAKTVFTLDSQQGNNAIQASVNLTVQAGKEVAFAHFHMVTTSTEAGVQWVTGMKTGKLFADLPKEIRREIVNFRVSNSLLGDLEVLRGEALDVVELRTGDKFNGNLQEPSYKLDTFYGTVEIPNDKVVGIINAGSFRPRQLIVTSDGQIFSGHLQKQTVELELTSGQKTQIPLAQIARVGYRHRSDEKDDSSDEQTLQPPYVLMTSGERVGVTMPTGPITVVTRYGQLELAPEVVSSITFNSEDSGVHTIELSDGSKFNGLATATEFDVKLSTGAKDQDVKVPTAALNRIIFSNRSEDKDESAATLQLKKDDMLVGTLQGDLKLDTAFDTISLNAGEIRAIAHAKETPSDLSITTWDGTVFSGQLQQQSVQCHLKCGVDVTVPIGLVESYTNPSVAVPPMILERIKQIVTDLNADDWKQRDAAEKSLVKMGAGVVPTLKQMRDGQPPEAQQRIDSVLKQLQK